MDSSQALAAELRFGEPEIRFTGYAAYDTVPALYARADVFVSPTYAEGFSNTILEAMAAGLAVVSCHAVGVSDCLRDEENGLLTMPGDVPALAAALTRIITDAALRRRLAAAGLEGVPPGLLVDGGGPADHGRLRRGGARDPRDGFLEHAPARSELPVPRRAAPSLSMAL